MMKRIWMDTTFRSYCTYIDAYDWRKYTIQDRFRIDNASSSNIFLLEV